MKIIYDPEADALYIQLRLIGPGEAENRDLGGGVVADYGSDGLLSGLEILDASLLLGKDDLERVILELSPLAQSARPSELVIAKKISCKTAKSFYILPPR